MTPPVGEVRREAACHCGSLRITCRGEPHFVAMCHCQLCQRRTGSSYSLGAWFDREAAAIEGPEQAFSRHGDDTDAELHFHFCPSCGTTLYWEAPTGSLPGMIGVAAGCFAEPEFPPPSLSVYGKRRHEWLPPLTDAPCFVASTASERESAPIGGGTKPQLAHRDRRDP